MRIKRRTKILVVLLLLIITTIFSVRIYTYTFSSFVTDETMLSNFYPDGMANHYKSINIISPGEDHRAWKFRLSKNEVEQVNNELNGTVWQELSLDGREYIDKAFFFDGFFACADEDEIYYCLYDLRNEAYKNLALVNTLLYGESNLLFVYNKTTAELYCVIKAVS